MLAICEETPLAEGSRAITHAIAYAASCCQAKRPASPTMPVVVWGGEDPDDWIEIAQALWEDGADHCALLTVKEGVIEACPDDGHAIAACPLGPANCSNGHAFDV